MRDWKVEILAIGKEISTDPSRTVKEEYLSKWYAINFE